MSELALDRFWRGAQRLALGWWRIIDLGAVVLVLLLSPSSYGRAARDRLARWRRCSAWSSRISLSSPRSAMG